MADTILVREDIVDKYEKVLSDFSFTKNQEDGLFVKYEKGRGE